MGSVKNLTVIVKPNSIQLGSGDFYFSNDFSVFDVGKMPDKIPGKGAALNMMAAHNFRVLKEKRIDTHFEGIPVGENRKTKLVGIGDLTEPSNLMRVRLLQVVKPTFSDGRYNYNEFSSGNLNNFVVPLEVIYRNGVPEGSSLLKKIKDLEEEGKTDELNLLLTRLGLKEVPKPGDLFPRPVYDFTTKFESSDRSLTYEEALSISGLSESQFKRLEGVRNYVVKVISSIASKAGFIDYDGKFEFGFYDGKIMLVDVLGTFDENRFMFNGEQVSKELLRQWYKKNQPEWYEACLAAKSKARTEGIEDWKTLVKIKPERLPERLVELVGEMYQAGADRYTGRNLFKRRPLEEVMSDLGEYRN